MASAINRISVGCNSFLSTLSSFISSSSMCKRPAVSTRMTSLADSFASLIAPLTISIGLSVPAPGQSAAPIALATCVSCSREWLKRSEEHTSELQSHSDLVCRLLLEKKKNEKERYET